MQHGPVAATSAVKLNGRRFHVVINATSIGINGDVPEGLWPRRPFAPGGLAYDLVYADAPTPFLRWASAQSAERTADGLGLPPFLKVADSGRYDSWLGFLVDEEAPST